jgi:hypothetical protein
MKDEWVTGVKKAFTGKALDCPLFAAAMRLSSAGVERG